jgi:hypothetical protein
MTTHPPTATPQQSSPPSAAHLGAVGRPLLLLLPIIGLLGVLYFAVRRPLLTIYDATIYVTGAQSLAQGAGYRALGYLAEPTITYYPPGYSAVLAPLFKLGLDFPANLTVLQLSSLLTFYLLLGLGALVLRRCYQATARDTAVAVLLAATTPLALILSTAVLSDTLFGVFVLASIFLVSSGWERRGPRGLALLGLGALCAAGAYYTRTAGIALVAALALCGLRQASYLGWGRVALLLIPALLVPPLLLWSAVNGGSSQLSQWLHGIPGVSIGVNSAEALAIVVLANLLTGSDVLWSVAPVLANDEILPLLPGGVPRPVTWLVASTFFVYVVWRSARAWWQRGELIHLFLVLYLLLTLLMTWRALGRYMWPIAPILAWYLVVALRDLCRWLGTRLGGRRLAIQPVVVGFLPATNLLWVVQVVLTSAHTGWPGDAPDRASYESLSRTAEYLRALDPPRAPIGTNHDGMISWWYLYTGRQGVDAIARADDVDPFHVRRAVQGDPEEIVYFVYHHANGSPWRDGQDLPALQAALRARGASTEPLYCEPDGSICVYDWRRRAAP